MKKCFPLPLTLLAFCAFCASAYGAGPDAAHLWSKKVQPLFDVQCVKCHGPIEQKGGLELDTLAALLKGGDSGAAVHPGDPDKSALLQHLAAGADPHMPPKKQLSESEIGMIRDWIRSLSTQTSTTQNSSRSRPAFASITEAIDALIGEAWQQAGLQPAPALSEEMWCRRVYLDLAGRIPASAETEAFLNEPAAERHGALVEKLLASAEYAVRMREWWDVFLMSRAKRGGGEDKRRQNGWWKFLEEAFRANRPWNETVRQLLVARPDKPELKGATWFLYERKNDHQAIAEAVAPVIYGTKIDCAQCHDHPLAREIKQAHYWGLVTAFNRSKNVEGSTAVTESAVGGFVNFTNLKKESQPAIVTLMTGKTLSETWLGGDQKQPDTDEQYVDPAAKVRVPKYSRREAFADLATHENPLLARAFVNRMWSALLGRGIVQPADEMNERNAPSHPELLEWLAEDFASHSYDVRRFVKGVVLSRVYALSSTSAPADSFAGALERPLTAEQVVRSWRVAAATQSDIEPLRRAAVLAMPDVLPREYNATYQQAQFLTTAAGLNDMLKAEPDGTLERLLSLQDSPARVEGAFKATLGRKPDADEAAQSTTFLEARRDRAAEGLRDLLWALMTSAEFLTMPR